MAEPSLELIQSMLQQVLDGQREHREDLRDIKLRLTQVETGIGAMRRDIGGLTETVAHAQAQIDRLSERVGRIERRLDLTDA
jgi:archaellum component FlaC